MQFIYNENIKAIEVTHIKVAVILNKLIGNYC